MSARKWILTLFWCDFNVIWHLELLGEHQLKKTPCKIKTNLFFFRKKLMCKIVHNVQNSQNPSKCPKCTNCTRCTDYYCIYSLNLIEKPQKNKYLFYWRLPLLVDYLKSRDAKASRYRYLDVDIYKSAHGLLIKKL